MSEAEVRQYKSIKDYYELLGVTKSATEDEIKKAYRKKALKFHPDKCKVDGAQDVFKKIAQAYSCLSDADKKAFYDRNGSEEPQHSAGGGGQYYYSENIDPNDIFNMFFGGGQFGGPQFQQRRQYRQQNRNAGAGHQGGGINLIQLLPLLILLFSSSFFSFFQSDPDYSLQRTYTYNIQRHTQAMDVSYFVDSSFMGKVRKDRSFLDKIDHEVESKYVNQLFSQCQQNQQYKRQLMQYANIQRSANNKDFYKQKASMVDLQSCRILEQLKQDHDLSYYLTHYG